MGRRYSKIAEKGVCFGKDSCFRNQFLCNLKSEGNKKSSSISWVWVNLFDSFDLVRFLLVWSNFSVKY